MILLLVLVCVGFPHYVTWFWRIQDKNSKYYSESLMNRLQVANQHIVAKFNENISVTNIAFKSSLGDNFLILNRRK